MSDNWDFYSCRVDDAPASIFVNLGIVRDVPLKDRPYMTYVRVFMRMPRSDGLSNQEEFEELVRLEDRITGALTAQNLTTYVERNTSGGLPRLLRQPAKARISASCGPLWASECVVEVPIASTPLTR